ncbi:DEAD/DEAH box helicase [Saccharibacillus sp. CPCC 101409]|uniref:DEAD/DEAH box helicase n=1 Tax=Saccharibacillus sp. CPCC 101409 TaxID=3058041 RepID=UPI0026732591|nr:DEAD/DEAH box helicase [Saccharibacillus sp. CPCC 101409]MDO3411452.1 DEAD/DEAH box helicase [Saccharibacillus sp. CPCC 101409]
MNQPLYGIWLGDVFFCFSGETSEPKVDAWTRQIRKLDIGGEKPLKQAALRLAELRWPGASSRRGRGRGFGGRTLEGLALPASAAFLLLENFDEQKFAAQGVAPGAELRYWSAAAAFARDLLAAGCFAPAADPPARVSARRASELTFTGTWKPLLRRPADLERFAALAAAMPPVGLTAPGAVGAEEESPPLGRARELVLHSFLSALIDGQIRAMLGGMRGALPQMRLPYRRGYSPLASLWWNSLLDPQRETKVQGHVDDIEELERQVGELGGAVPEPEGTGAAASAQLRLGLRLEPRAADASGAEEDRWKLAFRAEDELEAGASLPVSEIWRLGEDELVLRGRRYERPQRQLLTLLGRAAASAPQLEEALRRPHPEEAWLSAPEMFDFLTVGVPALRTSGVRIEMPSRFTKRGRRSAGVKLKARLEPGRGGEGETALGIRQLVEFDLEATIGEASVSLDELRRIAEDGAPLVFLNGEWIEIDMKEVRQVLRLLKKQTVHEMTFGELLKLSAAEDDSVWNGVTISGIETYGLLYDLLRGGGRASAGEKPVPAALNGTLRPYQERGYRWLASMREMGFGACLADDMGLGKTVQVIACLLDHPSPGPKLIVCPTSLLGNWQREIQRFAPKFTMHVHHGTQRLRGEAFESCVRGHDIVLTTYPLIGRDVEEFRGIVWTSVVLDEAQSIKNYGTKQAQNVMKLNSPHRIAVTGTPVENRLVELWSIFQFMNPGYLGSAAAFRRRFGSNLPQVPEQSEKLRTMVAPFMLRRLKSDPDIRKDLPEKIELKSYCELTIEQAAMYQSVVGELMQRVESSEASSRTVRQGIVLSALTRLKQICDHPALVKEPAGGAKAEKSGKLMQLIELLDRIRENGESVLIFTQYVRMGKLLAAELERRYGEEPMFLHGAVKKEERDRMIRTFQEGEGAGAFILSLKAGGLGLNLTRANHVVHFDRWWNPAVENQATDRVFRIGQRRGVQVHKLICQGTLEERIDEMIENKKTLAERVTGTGERWLTEMSNEELRTLVSLQGEQME